MNKKSLKKWCSEKYKNSKIAKFMSKFYINYTARVIIYAIMFLVTILLSLLFFKLAFNVEEAKVITYQETGAVDYKVYLKPNEFYETPYLGKDMFYVASLIKNIDANINYQFMIQEPVDGTISYEIIGNLIIAGDQGNSKLYEKEYVLKDKKNEKLKNQNVITINDNIVIDYDYYNNIANSFKSTYGVDASSNLNVYVRIYKNANKDSKGININETSQISLTIPLTQKTLNVQLNDTGINSSKSIVRESKTTFSNIFSGILSLVLFVCSVALILRTLELLFLLLPKKSKYDIFIKKTLNEYDRLIVETPSEPKFYDKEIIKINKFNELLDARDNLKRPIMYYNLIKHEKSYFYIENGNTVYLLIVKAVDLETEKKHK